MRSPRCSGGCGAAVRAAPGRARHRSAAASRARSWRRSAPAQALIELQAEHERLMQRVGLEPEGRKYTPHVTLARLRESSSRQVAEYLVGARAVPLAAVPGVALRAVLFARLDRRRALCGRGGLSAGGVTISHTGRNKRDCTSSMAVAKPWPSASISRISESGVGRGGVDLADDAAEIEAELGVELARELLHALVVGQTGHVQEFDAAVARREQRALEQRRADAVALPGLLDREGGFRLAREPAGRAAAARPRRAAFRRRRSRESTASMPNDEIGIAAHEFVRHRAGETVAPARRRRAAADGRDRARLRRSTICGSCRRRGRGSVASDHVLVIVACRRSHGRDSYLQRNISWQWRRHDEFVN